MGYTRKAQERLIQLFCIRKNPDDLLSFGSVPPSSGSHDDHTLELAHLYLRAVRVGAVIEGWLDMKKDDREPHITAFAGFIDYTDVWDPLARFLRQWVEVVQHREACALVWRERYKETYDQSNGPEARELPNLQALREEVEEYELETVGVLGRRLVTLEGFKPVTLKKKIALAGDIMEQYADPFTVPERTGLLCSFEDILEDTAKAYQDNDEESTSASESSSGFDFEPDDEDDVEAIVEQEAVPYTNFPQGDEEFGNGLEFLAHQHNSEKRLQIMWECEQQAEEAERQRADELETLLNMPPEIPDWEKLSSIESLAVEGLVKLAQEAATAWKLMLDPGSAPDRNCQYEQRHMIQARREELFCVHRHQRQGAFTLGPVYDGEDRPKALAHQYIRAAHVGAILDHVLSLHEPIPYLERFACEVRGIQLWAPLGQYLSKVWDVFSHRNEHIKQMELICEETGMTMDCSNDSIRQCCMLPDLMEFRSDVEFYTHEAFLAFLATDPCHPADLHLINRAGTHFQIVKNIIDCQKEPFCAFVTDRPCVCARTA
ncbi:hypothetical protein BDV96DRAFT_595682 [Lophiotrema nucula]|uniref:Uncharacterized protein n=1 Tax=Lophiotrema nucula TaxID=690887 RepID=A0A6A5ZLD9_9PLEO|nr:hypothetical protein BDV96DRAFT_595682 [Lophiotrema nucula]